jgi:hypothetical protein
MSGVFAGAADRPAASVKSRKKLPGAENFDFDFKDFDFYRRGEEKTDRTGLEPATSGLTGRRSKPAELPIHFFSFYRFAG